MLNSAHLLRLFHQSSKEANDILNNQTKRIEPESAELKSENNDEEVITSILRKNGLRLLWDALDNCELLRASLMVEYLKTRLAESDDSIASLKYFESQLTDKFFHVLTNEQTNCDFVKALNPSFSDRFIEFLMSELSKDVIKGSVKIINFYNNLKLQSNTCESISLFLEQESNFCEYPQLQYIKASRINQKFNVNELKNNVKSATEKFFTEKIDELPPIDLELFKGLELDDEVVNSISKKVHELKLKGNTEKLRSELSDFFDKLMKSIQNVIRSNSASFFVDEALKEKFASIYGTLEESLEIEPILKSFNQIISNKSNIIFTIHRSELSALNSKREIPIPSKLFLACFICDSLLQNGRKNNIFSKYINQQIKNKFYEMWLIDMKTTLNHLKANNNEIFSLAWLSDSFLTLQIPNELKSDVLIALGIEDVKSKYLPQAALLSGLFEPETISTPKLQYLNTSESTSELLPHFVPI